MSLDSTGFYSVTLALSSQEMSASRATSGERVNTAEIRVLSGQSLVKDSYGFQLTRAVRRNLECNLPRKPRSCHHP